MVYLLAAYANDADQMPSLLHALAAELAVPETSSTQETWGVGYYADERALIIKKPASILSERSVYELAPEVRSRLAVACADDEHERAAAPPFRFRRWLFGYTGSLSRLETLRDTLADKLPDFLRTELSPGPGALAFGMFLSELHRAGALEDALVDGPTLGQIFQRTTDTIRSLSTEVDGGPDQASFVATNGRVLLVRHSGAPISVKEQRGLERLPAGPLDPAMNDFKSLAAALKRFRAWVVAPGDLSDRPDWSAVADGQTLVFDGSLERHEV